MSIRPKLPLSSTFALIFIFLAVFLTTINYYFLDYPLKIIQFSMATMSATSLACLIGMIIASVKSRDTSWYIRTGWIVFMFAFVFDVAGNIIALFFPTISRLPLYSYFYLISYSLVSVGILFIPSNPRPQKPRNRQYIDIIVFVLASIIAVWVILIFPHIFNQNTSLDQAYIAFDYLMVFSVLDFLLRRKQNRFQKTSCLFALGIGTIVFGHILMVVLRTSFSLWLNFIMYFSWLVSDAAFCFAAIGLEFESNNHHKDDHQIKASRSEKGNDFLLPVAWVSLAYGILIWTHYNPETVSFPVLAIGTGSLIIMLIVRLMETLKENARLIADAHEEIKSRKTIQEKLWHDIRHDSLTELPNRSYLIDQLQVALETTREKNAVGSALFFLDLDRFKSINDNFGHGSGDELLKAVAERLIFCVRPDDFVTRLGGDEFAILLNNLQNSQTVYKVAGRIIDKMKEPFEIEDKVITSGVSFGIAYILPGTFSPEDIIKEADKAMYQAKKKGRGRFEISGNFEF